MWFDDVEPVHPQNLFNAPGDDPRMDHGPLRAEPAERWPLASDFHPFALRPDIDSGVMHFRHNDAGIGWERWQPDEETSEKAFATSVATETPDGGEIVVTGRRPDSGGPIIWTFSTAFGGIQLNGDSIEPIPWDYYPELLPDEDVITITVQLGRDPTTSELDALQSLRNTIAAIETAINALASNAGWSSPNGAHTTASELKFIWSKIDFVVNLETGFDNGSGLGQADYNYGDPIVTFNINTLVSYSTGSDTMNFLVAHELGHLSMAGDPNGNPFYTDQRTANDVARALLHGAGLPYWDNPGFGYTDGAPLQFSVL